MAMGEWRRFGDFKFLLVFDDPGFKEKAVDSALRTLRPLTCTDFSW